MYIYNRESSGGTANPQFESVQIMYNPTSMYHAVNLDYLKNYTNKIKKTITSTDSLIYVDLSKPRVFMAVVPSLGSLSAIKIELFPLISTTMYFNVYYYLNSNPPLFTYTNSSITNNTNSSVFGPYSFILSLLNGILKFTIYNNTSSYIVYEI